MGKQSKPLIWLHGEVKTPPFTPEARLECGYLLRRIQEGEVLGMPQCRPMPVIGPKCCELRVRDRDKNWRIILYNGAKETVVLEVFHKETESTPVSVIQTCKARLRKYLEE